MNKGIIYAGAAYAMWGIFPLYFKAIKTVPAFEILAHRVVWSFLFVVLLLLARKEITATLRSINRRTLFVYAVAGVLLGINWGTYVWAVNSGYIVESSLGYFINPLVSVMLGMIFLGERLRPLQWLPLILATAGVAYLTISYGSLPWISLVLALSFGFYGLMKKRAPLGAMPGLTLETAALFIPALGYLTFLQVNGTAAFGHAAPLTSLLLALTGVVTAVPLLFFAVGARTVSLTTIGLLQYGAPTLQFIIGVFIYHEPFDVSRLIGFSIIWVALAIFSAEALLSRRKLEQARRAALAASPDAS